MSLFLLLPLLVMHPFHVTLTEAEWNSQTECWECSLRVDPRDLDLALSTQAKRPVRSEAIDKEELQHRMKKYLGSRFRLLRSGADEQGTLKWVGSEVDKKYRWFYFELRPPTGRGELVMENRLFLEVQPGQRNTVVLRREKATPEALVFTESTTRQPMPLDQK